MLLNHTGSVAAGAVSTFAVGGVTVVSAGSMVGSSGTGVVGVAFGDGGVGSAVGLFASRKVSTYYLLGHVLFVRFLHDAKYLGHHAYIIPA